MNRLSRRGPHRCPAQGASVIPSGIDPMPASHAAAERADEHLS
jgi:hypothetical protein